MMTPALLVMAATVAAGAATQPMLATDGLVIASDSACPSAQEVRNALAGLLPADTRPRTTVAISAKETFLLVALGSRGSTSRQVAVGPDCGARATTVALIIATWLGDLPAETVAPPIPSPSRNPVAKPPSAGVAPRAGEIGAGLLAALVGGIVPGIRVEFARLRLPGGLGWQASLVLPAPREVAVGGGTTRFVRAAASAALQGRLASGRFFLSGDGGVAAAYALAWGRGYAVNQSDQSLTWGLVAGLRGGIPWGRVRIWTDVRTCKWLYEQSVQIDTDDGASTAKISLPSWDVQWALGASYAF